jgi:hypothetical protein
VNANPVTPPVSLRTSACGGKLELTAVLSCDASRLREVRMTFRDGLTRPIVQGLARSLLTRGLSTRAGEELAEAWPAGGGQSLVISLCQPNGSSAQFTAPDVERRLFPGGRLLAGRSRCRAGISAGIAGILAEGGAW